MNNELVKELASVRTWLAASDEYAIGVPSAEVSVAVIDRAIAFISSHDSVRDRVLTDVANGIRKALVGNPAHDEARVIAERVISNLRARWTAAPVVRKAGPCIICGLCHEHDETHGYYATQPAQEAPQSLVQWYRDEFTYLRDDPVTHRRIEHVLNKIDELREHDRRQGAK